MSVPTVHKKAALQLAARYLIRQFPQTVGVAFMELDCGCIKVCGATASGSPVAAMTLVLGKSAAKKDSPPVCRVCAADKGVNLNRLLHHGIIWPARKARQPTAELRQKIGQKLFGRRYAPRNDSFMDVG